MKFNKNLKYKQQSGISMFIGMVLLGVVSMISLVSARTTLLEVIMSGNEQKHITAFEKAESGIHALYDNRSTVIDFNMALKSSDCTANNSIDPGCTSFNVNLPSGLFGNESKAKITRVGEAALVCPPAYLEISCTDAKAAFFEIQSQFDRRGNGGGNVTITQGLLSILPEQ